MAKIDLSKPNSIIGKWREQWDDGVSNEIEIKEDGNFNFKWITGYLGGGPKYENDNGKWYSSYNLGKRYVYGDSYPRDFVDYNGRSVLNTTLYYLFVFEQQSGWPDDTLLKVTAYRPTNTKEYGAIVREWYMRKV